MMFLCVQVCAQQRRSHSQQRRTTTSVKKSNSQIIKKTRKVSKDGFIWYELQKGQLYGVADIDGNIIIPVKFTKISDNHFQHRYFTVFKGDFIGFYTRLGKCIISPEKHFTSALISSTKSQSGRVYMYVLVEDNNKRCGLYDIKGNEVVPLEYDYCWLADVGSILYIAIEKDGLTGALDLNGNLIVPPCTESLIYMHKDMISISHNDKKTEVIYKTNSEDTRFDYNNYDGLYKPFKSNESSSSSNSTSSDASTSPSKAKTSSGSINNNPSRQLQPMQVWVKCLACNGSGQCHICYGSGTSMSGSLCYLCNGRGKCTHCAGNGGHNEVQYR